MKKILIFSIFVFVISIAGCSSSKSPSKIYEEYTQQMKAGMTFEEEQTFYTKRKQEELEAQILRSMKQMNQSREEVIQLFQSFSQAAMECKEIALVEKKIEGGKAFLQYHQKDTCGNASGADIGKQTIRMINENGWKIDDIKIDLVIQ